MLVYFGYPQAYEDDAERAVRAGLELIQAVSGFDLRFALAHGPPGGVWSRKTRKAVGEQPARRRRRHLSQNSPGPCMSLRTWRSFSRATPRGLFGSIGLNAAHRGR